VNGPELVVEGLAFPEGLAWSPDDRCLLCSAVREGAVYRVWPESHHIEKFADVGGGANNLAPARGGGVVVCQNGGVHATRGIEPRGPEVFRTAIPGLMYVADDGTTSYIIDQGLNAPNDIALGSAGDLLFTDPGNPFISPRATPRVMRYSAIGGLSVFAEGFQYCNGICVDGESVLVTDRRGVLRFAHDGSREWVIGYDDGQVDGLAVDTQGRVYVTRQAHGGIDVIDMGKVVEFLSLPGDAKTTNACFGGPGLSWLFVTDAARGSVHVFTDMPTPGLPIAEWAPPDWVREGG
jgi:gluconolactonase